VLAVITDFLVSRQVTAQGDIVYIDKGSADGVVIGDWFNIIRPATHRAFMIQLPDETIAELRIIGVQDRTATALVTVTSDALHRGDVVTRASNKAGAPREISASVEPAAALIPARRQIADILFAFDRFTLSGKAKTDLAEVVALLKENPSATVFIAGYADERGSREYNLALGEKRASAVQQYLAGLGLKNPMTTSSFGEERPVCTDHSEPCYSINRRVHLMLEGN
jgi:outer membrane protein OmpA-like peptidoglycan-associated protein